MQLDHVLIAVPDLAAAAADFEDLYGLASVEGGRHPGWGTANRIVPLGDAYLELLAVVDEAEASGSRFGSWVADAPVAGRPRVLGWAVRTHELDAVAARLGLEPQPGSRARPDRSELRWRTAGVEQALSEPCLPFFIEWAAGAVLPGRAAEPAGTIERLDVTGDPNRVSAWLGEHSLPVAVDRGEPGIRGIALDVCGRSVVIGD